MDGAIPDYVEQKGSLFLRSDHMNYSRAVLNSNWHQVREQEPKDYDINKDPVRDMTWSTYKRLGSVTAGATPETTYQATSKQIFLQPKYSEQDRVRPMVNYENLRHTYLDRDTGDPKYGYGATLPYYNPQYNKHYMDTIYVTEYGPPYPYLPVIETAKDTEDLSAAYRKCHSQFADTCDYRRPGWNTFQDESGIYFNSHFKKQVFKNRNPIPENLL